ncbi:MAG: tRNA lysidine(34) synthetase TilS [Rhodobacteraceae bacterium]|nr:tRNA lysidine(34) synthetase TilS [Paracoccaceae bacterium]
MSQVTLYQKLATELLSGPDGPIGVAVSGGGDSVALLLLMADWAKLQERVLRVATVDHGLRDGSAAEAEMVSNLCRTLELDHQTLHWQGWDGAGNLQDAARKARQGLLGQWAAREGLAAIATGHTKDDQAETFLMRLARGSGVDGLAAIYSKSVVDGQVWLRPLLGISRQDLRKHLVTKGVDWVEDPSNQDESFERVRWRKAMGGLADLGLRADLLAQTAGRMQSARAALEKQTHRFALATAIPRESGSVRLNVQDFLRNLEEQQTRLLAHCLKWVSGATYRPRLDGLKRLIHGLSEGETATLSGCIVGFVDRQTIEICRECNAVENSNGVDTLFDGRWRVSGPNSKKPILIRVLGEDGIRERPLWRDSAESRNTILSSPSIWYNNELMSAPIVDKDGTWTCRLENSVHDFFTSIETH